MFTILISFRSSNNYNTALDYFIVNDVTESSICEIWVNRKSRQYDKQYFKLYEALYRVFVEDDIDSLPSVYSATKDIKIEKWWRRRCRIYWWKSKSIWSVLYWCCSWTYTRFCWRCYKFSKWFCKSIRITVPLLNFTNICEKSNMHYKKINLMMNIKVFIK